MGLTDFFKKNKHGINRERFNDVLTYCNEGQAILTIYDRLDKGDTISDSEIIGVFETYFKTIQTNCISAAELELAIIAPVCYHRHDLIDKIIRQGLLSLVMVGIQKSEIVVDFVNKHILDRQAEPYGGLPTDNGVKWLTDILPKDLDTLQGILDQVIDGNNKELEKIK